MVCVPDGWVATCCSVPLTRAVFSFPTGRISLKDSLEVLVIDEADQVLLYGYGDDVKEIVLALPPICQVGVVVVAWWRSQNVDPLQVCGAALCDFSPHVLL